MIKKTLLLAIRIILIPVLAFILFAYLCAGGLGEKHSFLTINDGKPLVFAHRGTLNYCVENSLESFRNADSLGFHAIETDIRSTKDRRIVIFHDENCLRLLGIDSALGELKYEDIKNKFLKYGNTPTSNHVSTLEEIISFYHTSKNFYLDVKVPEKFMADSLLEIFRKYNLYDKAIVANASFFFLAYIKYKEPKIRTSLEGFKSGKEWMYYLMPNDYKPDYYSSFIYEVDEKHIAFLKKNNLMKSKIVYGVDKTNLNDVFRLGLTNIIFDFDSTLPAPEAIEYRFKRYTN